MSLRWGLRYAALFVLVLAARVTVVDRFGSDLPQGDQWYGVGEVLLAPFMQHRLEPTDLLLPHNEHRIVLTRALDLSLFVIDGRWDARVGCTVNALLHAALACAVWAFGRRLLAGRFAVTWFAAVVLLFALPISWNNVIAAFHSQQVFLMGFSFLALTFLLTSRARSVHWWWGIVCAALTLVSMASGLLAAVVVLVTYLLFVPGHELMRHHRATLTALAVVVVVGMLTQVHVPRHDALRAQSFGYFLLSFGRQLQWPVKLIPGVVNFRVLPLLVWAPWLWLGVRLWSQRVRGTVPGESPGREHVLFAVGLWVLAQIAATAFVRGGDGPWPGSRFVDTIVAGVGVNVLAWLVLFATSRPRRKSLRILRVAAGVGLAFAFLGVIIHAASNWVNVLPERRAAMQAAENAIQTYLEGGDIGDLAGAEVAHPDPNALAQWLSIPEIRTVLPVSVNPTVGRGPLGKGAFVLGRCGPLLFFAGLLVAVASFLPASSRVGVVDCE